MFTVQENNTKTNTLFTNITIASFVCMCLTIVESIDRIAFATTTSAEQRSID